MKDSPPHLDSPHSARARHPLDSPDTPAELDTPDYYQEERRAHGQQRRIISPESPEVNFLRNKEKREI